MLIKTKISFREYRNLLFSLTYQRAVMIVLLCVALLVLLWIVFYHLHVLNLPEPVIYQYITFILIAIVQPTVIYFTIRRNYYSSNHLRETLQMELTDDRMKIKGESFYMEILWNKVFKIDEKEHWFLIYQNNLSAILIPKKSFNADQTAHFKHILRNITEAPVSLFD